LQASEGEPVDVPEHLCGGTYGRRTGKRKRGGKQKPTLSYAERKQRRILQKFGAGGQALGADDDTKVKLEKGVPKKGKPRVAGSARGRDLRAAAALARFDTVKREEVTIKKEESPSDSDTEDDFVDGDREGAALDVDGTSMFDDKGRALIKICEDDDDKDGDAQREMDEIQGFAPQPKPSKKQPTFSKPSTKQKAPSIPTLATEADGMKLTVTFVQSATAAPKTSSAQVISLSDIYKRRPNLNPPTTNPRPTRMSPSRITKSIVCPVCTSENDSGVLTCAICANVLNAALVLDHWRCKSSTCEESTYINAGDVGLCGVCGTVKGGS
jgi:hypothetical protein